MRTAGMRAIAMVVLAGTGLIAHTAVEKRSFTGVREVVVDNVNGPLEVEGYAGSTLEVEAERDVRASNEEERQLAEKEVKLVMEQNGGTVRVYVDGPFRCNCNDGWRGWRRSHYSVKYRIRVKVPAAAKLDARTVNGELTAKYSARPGSDLRLETVNGSVDTTFPQGFGADVQTKTLNGNVYSDFEVSALPAKVTVEQVGNMKRYSRSGTPFRVGGGGLALEMRTINGNIFVRSEK